MSGGKKSRKNARAVVGLVARYRSPTAFEFVEEQCYDLSKGGMFIRSPAPAPTGTLIKLECEVDQGEALIKGVARVVWLRETENDSGPVGMGVKFVKLEEGSRQVIEEVLARAENAPEEDGALAAAASAKAAAAKTPTVARDDIRETARGWGPGQDRSAAKPGAAASATSPAVSATTAATATPARTGSEAGDQAATDEAAWQPPPTTAEAATSAAPDAQGRFKSTLLWAPAPDATQDPGSEPQPAPAAGEAEAAGRGAATGTPVSDDRGAEAAGADDDAAASDGRAAETAEGEGEGEAPRASERPRRRPGARGLRERLQHSRRAGSHLPGEAGDHPADDEAAADAPAAQAAAATAEESAAGDTAAPAQEPPAETPASDAQPPAAASDEPAAAAAAVAATPAPELDDRTAFPLEGDVPTAGVNWRPVAIGVVSLAAAVALFLAVRSGARTSAPEPTPAPEPEPVAAEPTPAEPPPAAEAQAGAAGQPAEPEVVYVIHVVATPAGVRVSAGDQSVEAPNELALGALAEPVEVTASKEGYVSVTQTFDRTQFTGEGPTLRKVVRFKLERDQAAIAAEKEAEKAEAKREREQAEAERAAKAAAAKAEREAAAAERAARRAEEQAKRKAEADARAEARRKARAERAAAAPKPAPRPPKAEPDEPEPTPEPEEPAEAEPKLSPMEEAMACLTRGDNPCVVAALEGKASSAKALELLIETYRSMGNQTKAEQHMQRYIDKYPGERRANSYRRVLENRGE